MNSRQFWEKHGSEPPVLTEDEIEEYKNRQVGSERAEQWRDDVLEYNRKHGADIRATIQKRKIGLKKAEDELARRLKVEKLETRIEELEEEIRDCRESHAKICRGIKKVLGLKNWPKIKGNFGDGVIKLLEKWAKK